jgi:predicted O-methyltransferase YrrM
MLFENVLGWMTDKEIKILEELAELTPQQGTIVEVGSFFGRSACAWATVRPQSKIICIDIFFEKYIQRHKIADDICKIHNFPLSGKKYNVYEEFLKNTKDYSNITHIRGTSPQGIVYTNEEIDLFFLDAAHRNPSDWENIEFFLPFVKPGGIICGHDYNKENFPDVVENVHKLENILGNKARIIEDSSIWMIRK